MKSIRSIWILGFLFPVFGFAQSGKITPYGFLDAYYAMNVLHPEQPQLNFHTNYRDARHVSLNAGILGAAYSSENVRADVAFVTGVYSRNNFYSQGFSFGGISIPTTTEPTGYEHIYQMNGGIKLKENIWLDAGIFESFVGNESIRGIGNATLSRSLAAESTPYYLAGARVVWDQPSKNKTESFYLLNGYQRMVVAEPEAKMGFGFNRIQRYKSGHLFTFNFVAVPQMVQTPSNAFSLLGYTRLFLIDLSGVVKISEKTEIRPLLNIFANTKTESISTDLQKPEYATNVQILHTLNEKWSFAGRLEALWNFGMQRPWSFQTGNLTGNTIFGASMTANYQPAENAVLRFETRYLRANETPATDENSPLSVSVGLQIGF